MAAGTTAPRINHWAWYPPAPGHVRSPRWSPALVGFIGFNIGAVSVGVGFGNIGWVPLAPHEAFHPLVGSARWHDDRQQHRTSSTTTSTTATCTVNNAMTSVTRENFQAGRFRQPDGRICRGTARVAASGAGARNAADRSDPSEPALHAATRRRAVARIPADVDEPFLCRPLRRTRNVRRSANSKPRSHTPPTFHTPLPRMLAPRRRGGTGPIRGRASMRTATRTATAAATRVPDSAGLQPLGRAVVRSSGGAVVQPRGHARVQPV